MRMRKLAAAVAASAACFAVVAGAPPVGAADIDIYYSGASGDAIIGTFAIKPSILDPLAEAGALHTETKYNSSGGGTALALSAPVYPGSFGVGAIKSAVGCSGLPGGWLWGTYPPYPTCPRSQESVGLDSNKVTAITFGPSQTQAAFQAIRDHVKFKVLHALAEADLGMANAFVKTAGYSLVQDDATPPIVSARDVSVTNSGSRTLSAATQTVQIETKGVEILGGLIKIGSIVATATTASDGTTGVAEGSFRMADVTVTMNGQSHKAHIDHAGVTIDETDRDASLRLNEAFDEAMLQAGITIRASDPIDIVDGAQAEESVPGLQITFAGSPPAVPLPGELAPAYAQIINSIPTKCAYEFANAVDEQTARGGDQAPQIDKIAHVPLCFGAGVLPGSRNVPTLALRIASVQAFTVASEGYTFGGDLGGGSTVGSGGLGGGTNVLGEEFTNTQGGQPPVSALPGSGQGNAQGTLGQRPVAYGLVARLPSLVPLLAGLLFLMLAVGVALGPSLRHARPS